MTDRLEDDALRACQTPLVDLLRRIPKDAVLQWQEPEGLRAYCTSPVGKLAHEAADRLDGEAALGWREALTKCREKFAEYVVLHKAKLHDGTPTAEFLSVLKKVERNQEMVDMCDAALSAPVAAPSLDKVERVAYSVANAKLGEGPGVRCEGPTGYEIGVAREWVRRVFRALNDDRAALEALHKGEGK